MVRKLMNVVTVAVVLAAGVATALAEDAGPPPAAPHDEPPAQGAEPPPPPQGADAPAQSAQPPAPGTGAPPAQEPGPTPTTPPVFATPRDLLGKSVRDLERGRFGAAAKDDIKALRRGPLLIHGNYCGIGSRPGAPPVDALDAACMRHDACTHAGGMPNCRCDERLRVEASEVAGDPGTRPDIRAMAAATAAGMAVLICK